MHSINDQLVVIDLAQIISYFIAGVTSVLGMEHWWVGFTKASSADLYLIDRSVNNVLNSRVSNDLDLFKAYAVSVMTGVCIT